MKIKILKSVLTDVKAYTSFSNALLKVSLSKKQLNQASSSISQVQVRLSNLQKYEIDGKTPTFGIPGGPSFDVVKETKQEIEEYKKRAVADLEKAITTLKSL